MNIEEAKHILEGRKSILINSSMPDTSLITAIDIVLNELDNRIPREKIEQYRREFINDSRNENIFMTQSSQINASLIQFCNKLLNKE